MARDRKNQRKNNNSDRKSRENRRKTRERKRRRKTFAPYILIFILLATSIFFVAKSISHNVDRTVEKIEKAIKNDDIEYISENMDRLDNIFDVLKTSYSSDETKQDEFIKNNFKNLDIKILNKQDIDSGKEISLKITNVNYVKAFDKVKNLEKENQHQAYMKELSSDKAEVHSLDAKIFLKKKTFGYEIYESRDFINGIIGGALDLVQ